MEPTDFNKEVDLFPIVAAAGGDNNWEEQLRDPGGERGGWWIEMGGLNLFRYTDSSGKVRTGNGKYVGRSREIEGYGRFLVTGIEGLRDGVYHLDPANIDPIKAYLPQSLLTKLGIPTENLPFNKNTLVDLSSTLITPATQQDFERAKIEPEKRVDSRGLAEDRKKTTTTYGQLKPGDVVYDESNDVYGYVMSSSTEDGKTSVQIKWENNRVYQIDGIDPSKQVTHWPEPVEESEEASKPREPVVVEADSSTLKPGETLVLDGDEQVIASIRERKDPGTGEPIARVISFKPDANGNQFPDIEYNAGDIVEVKRVPAAAPRATKAPKPVDVINPGENEKQRFYSTGGDDLVAGNVVRHDGQNVIVMESRLLSQQERTPSAKYLVTAQDESGNVIQFAIAPNTFAKVLKNKSNKSPVNQKNKLKTKPATSTQTVSTTADDDDDAPIDVTDKAAVAKRKAEIEAENKQISAALKQLRDAKDKAGGVLSQENEDRIKKLEAIQNVLRAEYADLPEDDEDVNKDTSTNVDPKKEASEIASKMVVGDSTNNALVLDRLPVGTVIDNMYVKNGDGIWTAVDPKKVGISSTSADLVAGIPLKDGGTTPKRDRKITSLPEKNAVATPDTPATPATPAAPLADIKSAKPGDTFVIGDRIRVTILPDGKILIDGNTFSIQDAKKGLNIMKDVVAQFSRKGDGTGFLVFNDPKKPGAVHPDAPKAGWIVQITPKKKTLEALTVDLLNTLDAEAKKDRTVATESTGEISGEANTSGDLGGGSSYSISDSGVITINPSSGKSSDAIYEIYYEPGIPGVLALDSAGGPTDPITVQMESNTPAARAEVLRAISEALGGDEGTTDTAVQKPIGEMTDEEIQTEFAKLKEELSDIISQLSELAKSGASYGETTALRRTLLSTPEKEQKYLRYVELDQAIKSRANRDSTTSVEIPAGYENVGKVFGKDLKVGDIVNGKTIAEIGPTKDMDSMLYRVLTFTDGTVSKSIADADSFKDVLRKKEVLSSEDLMLRGSKEYWEFITEEIKKGTISKEKFVEAVETLFEYLYSKELENINVTVGDILSYEFGRKKIDPKEKIIEGYLNGLDGEDQSRIGEASEKYKNIFGDNVEAPSFKRIQSEYLKKLKDALAKEIARQYDNAVAAGNVPGLVTDDKTSTTKTALTPEKRAELETESDLLVDQGVNMGLIKRREKEEYKTFKDRISQLKSEARSLDDLALQELVNDRKSKIQEVAVREDGLAVNPNLTGFQNASIHRRINEGRYPGILPDERIKEINDLFMDLKNDDVGIIIRELDVAELNWRVKNGWSIEKLKSRWTDSRTGQPEFPSPEIAEIVNNYIPTKDEDGKPLSTIITTRANTASNTATTTNTTPVTTTTTAVQTGPTVEELLANSEAKKVSDINIGDRVFDTASQSFAVVIGVAESQMAKGKIEITIRYANGEETTIGFPKNKELLVYKEPKTVTPATSTVVEGTDSRDANDTAVENADDSPVEPGSTVAPTSNPARRNGPGKLTRINLNGYSKEEKILIIEFFMAYENLRKVQEEVEGRPYVPKHYIDPSDIPDGVLISEDKVTSKANKYAGRTTVGTPLGMRLSEASMDAVNPETGYTVYQPTPGAFTGAAADAFEGKTLSEIRDLFREMEVYAFDTETTGIARFDGDVTNNKPVQVGIVRAKNGEILERLNIYVNPGIENGVRLGKWSAENLVHDILDKNGNPILGEDGKPKTEKVTDEWLSEQMSMAEAAKVIIEFMGKSPMVVGQNVPFDIEILQQLLDAARIKDYSIGGTIDSKDLGSYLLPKYDPTTGTDGPKRLDSKTGKYIPSSSLGYLAEFLGFETTRWHSADGDAEDSLKLALAILDRAAEERPNEIDIIARRAEMSSIYDKKLAKFLAATHPDNPSTAKQHGAVVRDGFAEILDDYGIPENIKNAILQQVREMSRGEAAVFIKSFMENAESARKPSPIAGAPKQKVVPLPAITDKIKRRGRTDLRSQVRFVDKSEEKITPSNSETRLSESENTSPQFKNAVVLTGPALETFENSTEGHKRGPWLKPTPNEAGYIPSKKNKVAYEKAYQDYLARTSGLDELDDSDKRARFDKLIEQQRKDKRPHTVARVGNTNAYVRWRQGDASDEMIQATIDHVQELEDFNSIDDVPVIVTITKPGTFTVDKLFTNQEDDLGGSTLVTPFGVFISMNPEEYGKKDFATKPGRLGGNDSYITTLTHEYAHGIARVILGNMFNGVGKHHPRFEEFIRLFPEQGDDHPISQYGGETYGESFSEYFREAFWYIANKKQLPPKTDRLNNFMEWYEKVRVSARIMDMANVQLESEERKIGGLTFPPMVDTIGGDAAYEQEFIKRSEFYRNGLTPVQSPLTPEHASIIKDYFAVVKADGEGYYKTGSKEARDNYVSGIKILKSFYDSLFFGYAKEKPKNTLKSVSSRVTRNKDQYRSWTSDTSFLGIALGPGNYRNEIVPGEYTNNDGTTYPIVTVKSSLGTTEASVTYALDPSYGESEIDYSKLTLSDIKNMSIAKLQADNLDQEDKSLEILDVHVNDSYRRQGIATALLQSARSSTKNKIIHPEYPAGEGKAWASSIESDNSNLSATFKKFNDVYGIATQRDDGKDIAAPDLKTTAVDLKKVNLDKDETYYAGLTYGEEYNPILQDYTNPLGGLGQYRSVVGYVSVQALQQMRGNNVRSEKNLQKKIENFTSGRGLKQPITVFYDPDRGVAYVADGNHRVEAAEQAGVSHVPVVVQISKISEDENTKPVDAVSGTSTFSETGWPKNVHPYYVFKRENLINSDNIREPEISEEMISNVSLWTSKVDTDTVDRPNFTPDSDNILEKSPPGSYVLDNATGQVGRVYGYETIEVETDQGMVARNTGNIIVRFLDGIVDNMEEYRFSTTLEFNAAGKRTIPEGFSSEGGYNDYRIYTDEIRNPKDFENITDQYMKLSDQPIMILDSMYVIQRETGVKGRISGFPMPGYVELSYLTGEVDEDGIPTYETKEVPVSEVSPIQNQRNVPPGEEFLPHAEDMLPTKAQWDEINRYSNALFTWGYISKEQYNAIQMSLHGKFITRSGADRLRVELENFNLYRVHKVRTGKRNRTNARGPIVFEERDATPTVVKPVAPVKAPEKFDIKKVQGKMGFMDLLNAFRTEKVAVSEERRVATVTKSENTSNPPTPSQIDEVERGIAEEGALSEERSSQILSILSMLDGKSILPIIDEVNTGVLNKRILNDEPISDVNIPDGYNISKLEGYAPSEEKSLPSPEATDEDLGDLDENGIDPDDAIKLTPEQNQILDHAQLTNESFAVLAVAGTGKSTLERKMLKRLRKMGKNTIVVAPTGVASLNAGGQTIHQQFKLPTGLLGNKNAEELTKKYSNDDKEFFRSLSTLIIDEVSMVNADLMDGMDRVLRYVRGKMNEPFGGVQVIMFGDPLQLSPVPYGETVADNYMLENYQTEHFFSANAWAADPLQITSLTKILRQDEKTDPEFVEALNAIRVGEQTPAMLNYLWKTAEENKEREEPGIDTPNLVPTNKRADAINAAKLEALPGPIKTFIGSYEGPDAERIFKESSSGVPPKQLNLKIGAPVMFVMNDNNSLRKAAGVKGKKRRWVNGDVGVVTGQTSGNNGVLIIVQMKDGTRHMVPQAVWEHTSYTKNRRVDENRLKKETITDEVDASYTQYPLKLSWAITIHKSQGQTYESVNVDYSEGGAFTDGQTYVALSRLRSSKGLYLSVPIKKEDIKVDRSVIDFLERTNQMGLINMSEERSSSPKFDPLLGYESSAELDSAIEKNKVRGPDGESLTTYQQRALDYYLTKIRENPNNADMYRQKIAELYGSWFGEDSEGMSESKTVEVDVNNFKNAAERQALIDLLSSNGIPYKLKY